MKKFLFALCLLLCLSLAVICAGASDAVVFVSSGGTGDGSSADSPLGSLAEGFSAVGESGGTVVLTSDITISTATNLPDHTGTVTLTSVYGGVDYRTSNNAALRYTASARLVLGGPTVIDNFNIEIDQGANAGAVIAADFNPLKIGYGVEIVHNYTPTFPSRMFIIGGSNNDANGNGLAAGEECSLEIYSGDYMQVTAFSRGTANKAHYGTMNVTIGGDTTVYETYLGAVTTGASGGTVNLELKENAKLNGTGLFLSGNAGSMNGDVTVNVRDNAEITAISRYAASLHSGTKTVNVYGEDVSLPSSLDTYFDVVNIYIPKDTVTLTESINADNIVFVTADGTEISADITANESGITLKYTESLENFTLAITVKDSGYTVYEYTVTETDNTASAVLAGTNTYAGNVIYVGATDGNGLTPETPVSSFAKAYEMLIGNGGTFVVCGEITMSVAIVAPEHTGNLTVTSVYGGIDYRESGAKLVYPTSTGWQIGGDTVFENLTFDIATTAVISGAFHPLTFDEGIEVINDYSSADGNGLYLIGGHNKGTNTLDEYPDNTSVTVRSGHIRCIIGFSRYSGARVHTGQATINVEGDAYVRYVFGGAAQDNSTSKDTLINVKDKAIVENLYTGGSTKTNLTTGEVIIDVTELDGGDIYEFDTISIHTSDGKVKLHYDPRTVANGITTMATMARFEVLSPCDRAGEHTFGEVYANPFGGEFTAHTCEICDYTCLVEEAPEAVADGVVFVADGGFGDGLNPLHPFGNLEDAFNALGKEGGTIVLIDECTLPVNLEWKFGATHVSFQEPVHTGEVLITSVYGGTDYRESGAKLIFDGNMHYRLSGPTTFNQIVFDTVGNPTTNLVAARYNPLVFGEDCKMNKTTEDGYNLWVVGGYQYFRYTDFIGVEIEDKYLEMVTPARQKTWEFEPDDLVEFTYTAGNGNTYTPSLQKEAAAAFSQMFADMAAEGLYIPYCGWNFRSAHIQYGIFSDSVGNLRANGYDFDTSYLAVAKSASPAGSSEHQLGFAFDIYDERLEENYGVGNAHSHYDETPEWQWIMENGAKYGIIHRFLADKTAVTGFIYEAWHFRYVGVEHAKAIAETDYCLEEYVGETMGMFAKDSSVTALSGSFYQIMGGSRGCDNLTFTGTNRVTVGESATVVNLVDVDEEVKNEDEDTDFGEVTLAGDADGNGVLSLIDALRVLKYAVSNDVEINLANADMNGDKAVDILDVLLVIKAILNS
ncbi:MAG: D-alanyl-D-alanine carboxypeptidase family protein [Clostridia bacterium]|nr:D-alanyl-D-alanine carboxypeptidase family protein [Clostridia bacterium]